VVGREMLDDERVGDDEIKEWIKGAMGVM